MKTQQVHLVWPWQDRNRKFSLLKAITLALMFMPAVWLVDQVRTEQFGPVPIGGMTYWSGFWALALVLLAELAHSRFDHRDVAAERAWAIARHQHLLLTRRARALEIWVHQHHQHSPTLGLGRVVNQECGRSIGPPGRRLVDLEPGIDKRGTGVLGCFDRGGGLRPRPRRSCLLRRARRPRSSRPTSIRPRRTRPGTPGRCGWRPRWWRARRRP